MFFSFELVVVEVDCVELFVGIGDCFDDGFGEFCGVVD